MTNFTKSMMIAAAAFVAVAGAARAQSLKAVIPFNFQVAGQSLPAGLYDVATLSETAPIYRFRGQDGKSAAAMGYGQHDPQTQWKAEGNPKLAFACGETSCTLIELWDGSRPAQRIRYPKSVDMGTRIAIVNMRYEGKAD
jgi:hypothetical protein